MIRSDSKYQIIKVFYASKTANVIFSGKYLRQIRVNVAYSFSDSDISEEEDKDDQRKKIDEAKIDINVVQ